MLIICFPILVRYSSLRNMGGDSDWMFYVVVEAVTFCEAILSHITGVHQLPDVRSNPLWVELSDDDMYVSDGRIFVPRTASLPFQRTFADLTSFEHCVADCLYLLKFVGSACWHLGGWLEECISLSCHCCRGRSWRCHWRLWGLFLWMFTSKFAWIGGSAVMLKNPFLFSSWLL